jgi:ketosteroid isomerase-like protein
LTGVQTALDTIGEYYAAFSTLDMNAIVSYYAEPSMTIASQGMFSASNRTALAGFLAPMIDGLRAKGYGRSEFVQARVTTLGESDALVQGIAVRYTTSGLEMERIPLGYLMHRSGDGWKIAALVVEN